MSELAELQHDPLVVQRENVWIQTHSGRCVTPLALKEDDITIDDVAWALAHQCRYTGHCSQFYSVAQHSVIVSQMVAPELALAGLLHDASEAYIVDIPSPLKPQFREYKGFEDAAMRVLARRFGFPYPLPAEVKAADHVAFQFEAARLMGGPIAAKHGIPVPGDMEHLLDEWLPKRAYESFLDRFVMLTVPA